MTVSNIPHPVQLQCTDQASPAEMVLYMKEVSKVCDAIYQPAATQMNTDGSILITLVLVGWRTYR
jgi:hypothetical protein